MRLFQPKNSIICMFALVILVLCQHVIHFSEFRNSLLVILLSTPVMVLTFLYFAQISHILRNYYSVNGITVLCYMIGSGYILQYLSNFNYRVWRTEHSHFMMDLRIFFVALVLFLAVLLMILYFLLGRKLIVVPGYPNVTRLGFAFMVLIPIYFMMLLAVNFVPEYRLWTHLCIPLEMAPYWFSYKIYRDAMKAQAATSVDQ